MTLTLDITSLQKKKLFEIFSLPFQFSIDKKQLKTNYRQLQLQFHPDQHVNSAEAEKLQAVQVSSVLNDNYNLLRDPVQRAQYMLSLAGIDMLKDRRIDPAILMAQMEAREDLELLSSSCLKGENSAVEKVETMQAETEEQLKKVYAIFSRQCDSYWQIDGEVKAGVDTNAVSADMKQTLSSMMFLAKLIVEIERVLEP